MGLPDSRSQSFSRDVADGQSKGGAKFHHLEKISGEMAHREDFSSDFELAPDKFAGSAETALHLGGFKDGFLQFCLFAADCVQLVREKLCALRLIGFDRRQSLGGRAMVRDG